MGSLARLNKNLPEEACYHVTLIDYNHTGRKLIKPPGTFRSQIVSAKYTPRPASSRKTTQMAGGSYVLSSDYKMEQPLCAFCFFFCLGGARTTFMAASKTPLTFCMSRQFSNLRKLMPNKCLDSYKQE